MRDSLTTEAELAEILGVPTAKVAEWRRKYGWPCVKIGHAVRFTETHIDFIIKAHTLPGRVPLKGVPGQTELSMRRHETARRRRRPQRRA